MKLLVGYDGSNSAKEALLLACTHAKAFNAELEIVRSMEPSAADEDDAIEQAEKDLQSAEAGASGKGISTSSHLLIRGLNPGEDIVQFAEENAVDAIFIGVIRRSRVGKLLFGSNAQYIILKAPCPVMTVK